MLQPKAVLLSAEHNPLLRWLFKHTFYAQFCAGENKAEVQRTISTVKAVGYKGVILEYALELLNSNDTTAASCAVWRRGMLDSVDMASPGDFVALKWSGLGVEALTNLNAGMPPTATMEKAIHEVCDVAAAKGVAMLPGAELEVTNRGIDAWTLDLQRKYNVEKPLMYTTYQAYLRSTPARIARDLAAAQKEGFILGVKLVRGAYLAREPRDAVCATKEETDAAYDGLAAALLTRSYNDVLAPAVPDRPFPRVALFLCTHNADSIAAARRIRNAQVARGEQRVECAYAQLQGMADEISTGLVAAAKALGTGDGVRGDIPQAFKCATWGTVPECLHFLYRRALENQDAVSRTVETRKAMGNELWRRVKGAFGA
jgi:Proline dehydrogenase